MRLTTTEIETQRIRAKLWRDVFQHVHSDKYTLDAAIKAANAALDRFDATGGRKASDE